MPQPAGTDPWWYTVDWKDTTNIVLAYSGPIAEVSQPPAYIIEDLGTFRITSYNVCYTKLLRVHL